MDPEVLSLRAGCQRRSFVGGNVAKSPPFLSSVLPELLGKCYTRPPVVACPVNAVSVDSSEKPQALWCYCQKEESGDMVACDSGSCQYE